MCLILLLIREHIEYVVGGTARANAREAEIS